MPVILFRVIFIIIFHKIAKNHISSLAIQCYDGNVSVLTINGGELTSSHNLLRFGEIQSLFCRMSYVDSGSRSI